MQQREETAESAIKSSSRVKFYAKREPFPSNERMTAQTPPHLPPLSSFHAHVTTPFAKRWKGEEKGQNGRRRRQPSISRPQLPGRTDG